MPGDQRGGRQQRMNRSRSIRSTLAAAHRRLLSLEQFQKILDTVRRCFKTDGLKEISLEANPGTVDRPYLTGLRELGVNRLSLGAQSALPQELALLGRIHTVTGIRQAVRGCASGGF